MSDWHRGNALLTRHIGHNVTISQWPCKCSLFRCTDCNEEVPLFSFACPTKKHGRDDAKVSTNRLKTVEAP